MIPESENNEGAAKWFAQVNDVNVICPQQVISARMLRHLAEVPEGDALFRDFNSPEDDPKVASDEKIDLGDCNVFYARRDCEGGRAGSCKGRPKMAFAVDDRMKVTETPEHTGAQLKELFGLDPGVELLRDLETPRDEVIGNEALLRFRDGPVFVTRKECGPKLVKITINGVTFDVAPGTYTIAAIKMIPQPDIPAEYTLSVVKDRKIEPLPSDSSIVIAGCEVFISNKPTGGAS